jgi:hypothetical protein
MITLSFSVMFRRCLVWFTVLLALAPVLHAQIEVSLKISRRLFMAYEPIVATVTITNLAGRDILLQDAEGQKWFGFSITNSEESPVPPRDMNYQVSPLSVPAGQSVKRKVNLNELYPVNDFGLYRVRASIYFADMHKYFSSTPAGVEISEGKVVWRQVVGVPEGQEGAGSNRVITLLTFRQLKDNELYARIEDPDAGIMFCTHPIGRVLVEEAPQVVLDDQNQVHVLQLVGPKTYTYTRIGLNGEVMEQTSYNQLKSKPHLKKIANGNVAVAGGQLEEPIAAEAGTAKVPKLSDRPPGLPGN